MRELDNEITAISTIRRILERFVSELEAVTNVNIGLSFLDSEAVQAITTAKSMRNSPRPSRNCERSNAMLATDETDFELFCDSSLSLIQSTNKEMIAMNELNQAAEILDKRHQVKLRVELAFNGNCTEAIMLYEQAFGIKANGVLRYKDAPPEDGTTHPAGTEDYVMHTWLRLGNDPIGEIGMHDRVPSNPSSCGDAVSISVGLASAEAVHAAFDTLKTGGTIITAPVKEHFCDCFGEVRDKFGVNWILMYN